VKWEEVKAIDFK